MDIVTELLRYVGARFENPRRLTGTCSLTLRDGTLEETVWLGLTEHALERVPECVPDASIMLDRDLMVAMMETKGAIEFRRAEFQGRFKVEGRQELVDVLRTLMRVIPLERRRLFEEVEALARASDSLTVERLHAPTHAQVAEALAELRPVVADGLIEHWAAKASTPEALAERFPSEAAALHRDGRTRTMTEMVLDMAQAPTGVYSGGFVLSSSFMEHFPPPLFDASFFVPHPRIWMGRSSSADVPITALHRDSAIAVLGHLYGQKRFLLYSPDQADLLYAHHNCGVDRSPVQRWAPDLERFPAFARARSLQVDLRPGEVLMLPTGWWHEIYAVDGPVMSISYFSANPRSFWRSAAERDS